MMYGARTCCTKTEHGACQGNDSLKDNALAGMLCMSGGWDQRQNGTLVAESR